MRRIESLTSGSSLVTENRAPPVRFVDMTFPPSVTRLIKHLVPTGGVDGMLHGRVVLTERLGSETVVDVVLRDGSTIIASVAEDRVYAPDEPTGLRFDPARAHPFPPA